MIFIGCRLEVTTTASLAISLQSVRPAGPEDSRGRKFALRQSPITNTGQQLLFVTYKIPICCKLYSQLKRGCKKLLKLYKAETKL